MLARFEKRKRYSVVAILMAALSLLPMLVFLSYQTLAYSTIMVESWLARYNGPGNSSDSVAAVATDASGNVYVTGYSIGNGTDYDYTTIKYNSAGGEQWVARYDGPGHGADLTSALAVDASGNVYVTGWSRGSGTGDDYATIKYNRTGVQQWVARYHDIGTDIARALTIDASGNVYVTGESDHSGTGYDYATIKYNSTGTEQWVKRYTGPGINLDAGKALAVDGAGNVYVTGYSRGSGTGLDYATVKYNSSGAEKWVTRYNGSGNGDDYANAIAIDASGNVYITGYSRGSGTSFDYATVKYSNSGVQQWAVRYDSPTHLEDRAVAMATDTSGNVYVSGYSIGAVTDYDYTTIKYNSAGTEQWVTRYNGPGNRADYATALVMDPSGNIYVTGYSYGNSSTGVDYATVKYDGSGAQQWTVRYNGPVNGGDYATALAIDASGNIYAAGYSMSSGNGNDCATVKYSMIPIDTDTVTITGNVQAAIDVTAPADFDMTLIPGTTSTSDVQSVTVKCNKPGWTLTVSGTNGGYMNNVSYGNLTNPFTVAGGDLSGYQPLTSPRYLENGSSGAGVGITAIGGITFRQAADWNDSAGDYTIVVTFTGTTN